MLSRADPPSSRRGAARNCVLPGIVRCNAGSNRQTAKTSYRRKFHRNYKYSLALAPQRKRARDMESWGKLLLDVFQGSGRIHPPGEYASQESGRRPRYRRPGCSRQRQVYRACGIAPLPLQIIPPFHIGMHRAILLCQRQRPTWDLAYSSPIESPLGQWCRRILPDRRKRVAVDPSPARGCLPASGDTHWARMRGSLVWLSRFSLGWFCGSGIQVRPEPGRHADRSAAQQCTECSSVHIKMFGAGLMNGQV